MLYCTTLAATRPGWGHLACYEPVGWSDACIQLFHLSSVSLAYGRNIWRGSGPGFTHQSLWCTPKKFVVFFLWSRSQNLHSNNSYIIPIFVNSIAILFIPLLLTQFTCILCHFRDKCIPLYSLPHLSKFVCMTL